MKKRFARMLWSLPLIGRLPCLMGWHYADRRRRRHDGIDFVAPCLGCGISLWRNDGRWSPDQPLLGGPQ